VIRRIFIDLVLTRYTPYYLNGGVQQGRNQRKICLGGTKVTFGQRLGRQRSAVNYDTTFVAMIS